MHLTALRLNTEHFKLVIAGAGAAGSAVASHFCRSLPPGQVAIVDPSQKHYYQPGFTLLAANLMSADSLVRPRSECLPASVQWLQTGIEQFDPKANRILLRNNKTIEYDFLVVATGLELRFDLIQGLPEAFDTPGVCSIYDWTLAKKCQKEIADFNGGFALFTFPNTPLKCAGAPQKICYLAEEIFRRNNVRDKTQVIYNTPLGRIFGVDKYARSLDRVIAERNIQVNYHHNLVKIDPDKRMAHFEITDSDQKGHVPIVKEIPYNFLHVGPPCSPIKALRDASNSNIGLTDDKGWVNVDSKSLQSVNFPNVFGIGDCTNTPNGKTAAAVSSQFKALKRNLANVMQGKQCDSEYDGYASCPLVVDSKHVILAEFNADGPLETMPYDQSKPRYTSYLMKRHLMPFLYWNMLIKGRWNGPANIRKIMHLGFGK